MKKKNIFFSIVVICLLVFAAAGYYWYQKPRQSIGNTKAAYSLQAKELYKAFERDEKKANEQYVGKVIEVTGNVESIQTLDSTVSVLLAAGNEMGGINCSLAKDGNYKNEQLQKGNNVKVKGRCVGFLMDVNLVDAVIEK